MASGVDQESPPEAQGRLARPRLEGAHRDPDRVERSRTFRTEADARRFASKIEVSVNEGTYIDPSLGRTQFKSWAEDWLEASEPALKPHTISGYRTLLRKHVIPALGSMQLAKVRAIDVRRFVAELSNAGLSPSRVRSTYFLVQAIFRAAVESGYIGRSPCIGVKLPRSVVREMNFISADQVKAIGAAIPEQADETLPERAAIPCHLRSKGPLGPRARADETPIHPSTLE